MIEPIVRILLRYLALPMLLWFGLPDDMATEIVNDPDVRAVLMFGLPAIAGLVEGWWLMARRKGRST